MNPTEAKCLRWLRRVKRGGSGRLVLGHVDVAGRGAQLGEWPVRDSDSPEALEQITLDVMQVAHDDTDGQAAHTPQQYLALYYTEESQDAYSRFKFRLAPPQSDFTSGQAISSEPPTESGLVAQAMRFLEMGQRASWGGMGAVIQTMQHQLTRADERDARHEERHERREARYLEMMERLEAMRTEEHLRETATMAAHHEREDRRAFHSNVTLLGSSLLAKFNPSAPTHALPPSGPAPSGPAPSDPAPSDPNSVAPPVGAEAPASAGPSAGISAEAMQQVRWLMESITDEQKLALQQVLRPPQLLALMTLYNSVAPEEPTPA